MSVPATTGHFMGPSRAHSRLREERTVRSRPGCPLRPGAPPVGRGRRLTGRACRAARYSNHPRSQPSEDVRPGSERDRKAGWGRSGDAVRPIGPREARCRDPAGRRLRRDGEIDRASLAVERDGGLGRAVAAGRSAPPARAVEGPQRGELGSERAAVDGGGEDRLGGALVPSVGERRHRPHRPVERLSRWQPSADGPLLHPRRAGGRERDGDVTGETSRRSSTKYPPPRPPARAIGAPAARTRSAGGTGRRRRSASGRASASSPRRSRRSRTPGDRARAAAPPSRRSDNP